MRQNAKFGVDDKTSKLIFARRSLSGLLDDTQFELLCDDIIIGRESLRCDPLEMLNRLEHAVQKVKGKRFTEESGWLLFYLYETFLFAFLTLKLSYVRPKGSESVLERVPLVLKALERPLAALKVFSVFKRHVEDLLREGRKINALEGVNASHSCEEDEWSDALWTQYYKETPRTEHHFGRWEMLRKVDDTLQEESIIGVYTDVYGSYRSGLNHRKSDVDIICRFESTVGMKRDESAVGKKKDELTVEKRVTESTAGKASLLREISFPLRDRNVLVQSILSARVPILKLRLVRVGMEADVSFCEEECVAVHSMFRAFVLSDIRVGPFLVLIKAWSRSRFISDAYRGLLGPFGWVMLGLFFLQSVRPAVLPQLSLSEASSKPESESVGFWCSCICSWRQKELKNLNSLGTLFEGFFAFYSAFQFDEREISIDGAKGDFRHGQERCLSLVDPMDRSNNVARNITEGSLRLLKGHLEDAHRLIGKGASVSKVMRGDGVRANLR